MIRTDVDAVRRRVSVTLAGEVTGPEYVTWLLDLVAARPELRGYDFVYDLYAYAGRVSHDDIAALARRCAAMPGEADRGAMTVLVTMDEGFRFWVGLLAVQFPNRTWRVVPTLAAAEAVLAAAEAARRGAGPAGDPPA